MTFDSVISGAGDGVWSIGFFLLSILIIVLVHEFGHYIVGRWSGIHAEVFSLGFGKVLLARTDRHGTRWQLAAIPLGGFVKFLGDASASSANPDVETLERLGSAGRRRTLHGAPLWARAATVLAGPVFNILLTLAVFMLMITLWGVTKGEDLPLIKTARAVPGFDQVLHPGDQILSIDGTPTPDVQSVHDAANALALAPSTTYQLRRGGQDITVTGPYLLPPVIGSIMAKSAAIDAGLREGDVITAVGGVKVGSFAEIPPLVAAANGAPVALTIWREGESFDLSLTPRRRDMPTADGGFETRWLIGLTSSMAVEFASTRPGPWETVKYAFQNTVRAVESSFTGIAAIIRGQISSCNISGAISMAQIMGDAAQTGWESFLGTLALLSLGIGLMNLMPVPVLDGGHLVFHAWEAITGRPPAPKVLERLTVIGLGIVLGVMAYALRNDFICV